MPSPGGIIRVPEANFLLHDLGLEQIWKRGWLEKVQSTNRLAEGALWGKMDATKPHFGILCHPT